MNRVQLSARIAAIAVSGVAVGNPMPFEIFENQDGVSTNGLDVGVDAFDAGDAIEFVITNDSSIGGIITQILIERSGTSAGLGAFDLLGAPWESASNRTPPGSLHHDHAAWQGTLFSFRSEPPRPHNGLDSGDSLTIRIDLDELSFDEAYSAFTGGEFRFVTHIQSLGDSSVWGVNVPSPTTLVILGAAGVCASRRKR